ncbi:MAG: hypothetical protein IPK33_20105 [Gemmatimonadetes bacterium]|nr:hypothetical protein [Gemmatimonadota bacterium]
MSDLYSARGARPAVAPLVTGTVVFVAAVALGSKGSARASGRARSLRGHW